MNQNALHELSLQRGRRRLGRLRDDFSDLVVGEDGRGTGTGTQEGKVQQRGHRNLDRRRGTRQPRSDVLEHIRHRRPQARSESGLSEPVGVVLRSRVLHGADVSQGLAPASFPPPRGRHPAAEDGQGRPRHEGREVGRPDVQARLALVRDVRSSRRLLGAEVLAPGLRGRPFGRLREIPERPATSRG